MYFVHHSLLFVHHSLLCTNNSLCFSFIDTHMRAILIVSGNIMRDIINIHHVVGAMTRCYGETKANIRCKRTVAKGTLCHSHKDQTEHVRFIHLVFMLWRLESKYRQVLSSYNVSIA